MLNYKVLHKFNKNQYVNWLKKEAKAQNSDYDNFLGRLTMCGDYADPLDLIDLDTVIIYENIDDDETRTYILGNPTEDAEYEIEDLYRSHIDRFKTLQ